MIASNIFRERRRIPSFVFLMALCSASSVGAHDFWLQPNEFWLKPQAETPFTLLVGHGAFRQRSPIPLRRITRFEAIAPDGTAIDLRGNLHPGGDTDDGNFRFLNDGAYVLVLETDDHAQSHLPAIRFNDYLKAEGLTTALAQRERLHRMDADGSENYSRRAKSIVQVGPAGARSSAQVTRPLGLPLEIVAEQNPYAEPRAATLPVIVIYQGRPLAGALIKLTNLDDDISPFEMHLTDHAGRAIFTMPTSGTWLLNVIWTRPLPGSRDAEFETIFSSLTFGFPPVRPGEKHLAKSLFLHGDLPSRQQPRRAAP